MYCVLRCIDYISFLKFHDNRSVSTLQTTQSSQIEAKIYFNPNCVLQLILDYLCNEAHLNVDDDSYDLCSEYGDLLGIKDYKPTVDGLTIFKPRETYYIVITTKNEVTNAFESIIPLLNPYTEEYKSLQQKINEKHLEIKKSSVTKLRRKNSRASSRRSLTFSDSSARSQKNSTGKRISVSAII